MLDSGFLLSSVFPGGSDSFIKTCSTKQVEEARQDTIAQQWWQDAINLEKFNELFLGQCKGKSQCSALIDLEPLLNDGVSVSKIDNVNVFAQVACSQSDQTLLNKNYLGLAAACIGLFMILIFSIRIGYMQVATDIHGS